MSVPSWQRKLAHTQYIYEAYLMCIDIGRMTARLPKKYRQNYGDTLIKDSLDCFKYCRLANSIFMSRKTSEEEYNLRTKYLKRAKILASHVSCVGDVFLKLCYNTDGVKSERIDAYQHNISSHCVELNNLITGVLKHDKNIWLRSA